MIRNYIMTMHKFGLFILLTILFVGCGKKETAQIPLGQAVKGTIYIDIFEEGEIEAVRSLNLVAPEISWRYGNLKINQIVKSGLEVNAGDTLVVFDPSEIMKGITEAESRMEISVAELDGLRAQHESQLEDINASYEIARITLEITKIKFESAEYESEMQKKKMQLDLEKAEIDLTKAKEEIDNTIKIQKEELKQKNLSIEQDRIRLKEAHETLAKLNLVSPANGIAIIGQNPFTGNKFQMGDQCWSGFPIIQLPDLSALKAIVKISEVDISKISKGMKVEIRPDAFSDKVFEGEINSIANLAVNKEGSTKIKVFPVEVLIKETDKNLLPGLTVSCRIIVDKIDDVLYVPVDAVVTEADKSFVYKKNGKSYDKVEVETGISNTDFIVITKGLNENDKVALSDPFAEEKSKEETTK